MRDVRCEANLRREPSERKAVYEGFRRGGGRRRKEEEGGGRKRRKRRKKGVQQWRM
jgi:hypothetical protein